MGVLGGSGPEECEGDDGDAVGAAAGVLAGVDDHLVDEAVAELLGQPVEVLDVCGSDGVGEFGLDRDCGSVCRFYDGRFPGGCSWCEGARCGRRPLRRRPAHRLGGQRLEMRALSSETITGMMYLYLILSSVRR